MKPGRAFQVHEREGAWLRITCGNQEGWTVTSVGGVEFVQPRAAKEQEKQLGLLPALPPANM